MVRAYSARAGTHQGEHHVARSGLQVEGVLQVVVVVVVATACSAMAQ
jgi:hypothetical protein